MRVLYQLLAHFFLLFFASLLFAGAHESTVAPSAPPLYTSIFDSNGKSIERNKNNNTSVDWESMSDQLRSINIFDQWIPQLSILTEYHIEIIIDDSGSMGKNDTHLCYESTLHKSLTRLQELKLRLTDLFNVITHVATQGITLSKLSDLDSPVHIDGNLTVFDKKRTGDAFIRSLNSKGATPLIKAMMNSFNRALYANQPTLLYVFTDGEPTDYFQSQTGGSAVKNLINYYFRRQPSTCEYIMSWFGYPVPTSIAPNFFPITFFACTGSDDTVEWLNDIDQSCSSVQVMDDYLSEMKEVYNNHGGYIDYSTGAYLLAGILGGIDSFWDNLDEPRNLTMAQLNSVRNRPLSSADYQRYLQVTQVSREQQKHYTSSSEHPLESDTTPFIMGGATICRWKKFTSHAYRFDY